MTEREKRILMLLVSIVVSIWAELNRRGIIVPSVAMGNAVIDLKNEVDTYLDL
jgi:hypothetical protein